MVVRANGHVHGVVLAGVHPWQDNAFDSILPRPLLPVAQRPLICHVLRWLRQGDIHRATICANSASRHVRHYLGDGSRLKMDLTYYEDCTPRGPAGCVHDAASHNSADTYLIADGTILPQQIDLADLLAAHERSKAYVTVAVCPEFSSLATDLADQVPIGIYVFSREAIATVCRTGYQDIKEVLIPRLHQAGHNIATYVAASYCPRVYDFSSYLRANNWLLQQMADPEYSLLHHRRIGDSQVHEQAQINPAARLVGPVLIGPGSEIRDRATLVGPCVIGQDSVVEAGAVVCRSVLWDRCQVGPQAVVDRCVVTQEACIPPGAQISTTVHTTRPSGTAGWLDWLRVRKAPAIVRTPTPAGPLPAMPMGRARPRRGATPERMPAEAASV